MQATKAAISTFREVYAHPETGFSSSSNRSSVYDILYSYYWNLALEDGAKYGSYLARHNLYTGSRLIYNPFQRLVDFYAGQVYPGVLSIDGLSPKESIPLAIPLNDDIDPDLRFAIAQFWAWSNFQSQKNRIVRTGAMTGNVLISVIDDVNRSKVMASPIWPGYVYDLELDQAGNVKAYAIEYQSQEKGNDLFSSSFVYRKEIDEDSVRTYRDGAPYGFDGNPAEYPNPYGFVPAVWVRHIENGTDYGDPAIGSSIPLIDELNSLAAHLHDHIHRQIETPQLISTDHPISSALKPKDAAEAGINKAEGKLLLKTGGGASVSSLIGNLDIEKAAPHIDRLITELEKKHPELTFYEKLREMSQVTGPGAKALMGDVQGRVWEAAANYDAQMIKLFQMAVAIGGWRYSRGDWLLDNDQTEKFRMFDLDSYRAGDLDLSIKARLLIPESETERIDQRGKQIEQAVKLDPYLDRKTILREAGYSEEEIVEILARKDREKEEAMKEQERIFQMRNQGSSENDDQNNDSDEGEDQ